MGIFGPAPPFPAEQKMAKTSNFWLIFLVFYFVLRCSLGANIFFGRGGGSYPEIPPGGGHDCLNLNFRQKMNFP